MFAEELLRAEGFTDVQYLAFPEEGIAAYRRLGSGEIDISQGFIAPSVTEIDRGTPLVLLAGVHVGCFELFGTERVRAIRDLKERTVAVPAYGSSPHVFLATILAYVGLDVRRDGNLIERTPAESKRLLAEGKIDAYLGFPPDPQELRAKKIGHVILKSATDRPWSQYFCCLRVRTIKDLKGRKVGILTLDSAQHIFLASMATQVGLDPQRDVEWVAKRSRRS